MKRWVQEGQKVPRTPGNCGGVCGEERSPWALFSLHVDMRHHCCRRSIGASVQALALERGAKGGITGQQLSVLPTDLPPPSLGLLTLSAEGQGDPASFCHLMYVARDSRTLDYSAGRKEFGHTP